MRSENYWLPSGAEESRLKIYDILVEEGVDPATVLQKGMTKDTYMHMDKSKGADKKVFTPTPWPEGVWPKVKPFLVREGVIV